eukprot:TRINITY_DN19334_c0_g1_i1.p1 TRINITY_DN19334_c0_g1~~TRINITY_DN19334_c0_g1_i1.p1  ORF type:complete len:711 (+),score=143.54 TRINITY_DN19334_c0_g1_i1:96-2228(+)
MRASTTFWNWLLPCSLTWTFLNCCSSSAGAEAGGDELSSGLVVELKAGSIRGVFREGVREFLGIPYAAPPVGPLRFLPPQPVQPWAPRLLDANLVSAGCWRDSDWFTLNPQKDEDCLYLNVWAPPTHKLQRPVPVLVWIYGGGYASGSGDDLQTRGDQLVRTHGDVIVVSFNYRLGAFGFLGSEELRSYTYNRTGLNTTGNAGFLDQVEVLKWVQQNAKAFGGDPGNVMLFGESVGASSCSIHLVSPLSRGLFHSVAMESGGFTRWSTLTVDHASDDFKALAKALTKKAVSGDPRALKQMKRRYNCSPDETALACVTNQSLPARLLQLVTGDSIFRYERRSSDWSGMEQCDWAPTIDGYVMTDHPFHLLQRGEWANVPVIIGVNKEDGTEFVDGCQNDEDYWGYPTCKMNYHLYNRLYRYFKHESKINDPRCFQDPLYKKWLKVNWGSWNLKALYDLYNSTSSSPFRTNYWAAQELVGDYIMYCTSRHASFSMSSSQKVFQYYFAHRPREAPFTNPWNWKDTITGGYGACHGCEIPFVFNRNDSRWYGVEGRGEKQLALSMSSYWTNLAWSGDPNKPGQRFGPAATWKLPDWPQTPRRTSDTVLILDAGKEEQAISVDKVHPRARGCTGFWDNYFVSNGWIINGTTGTKEHERRLPYHPDDDDYYYLDYYDDYYGGRWRICHYHDDASLLTGGQTTGGGVVTSTTPEIVI